MMLEADSLAEDARSSKMGVFPQNVGDNLQIVHWQYSQRLAE
jgi:hypothetical protein